MALNIMHVCGGNLFGGVEAVLLTYAREEKNYPELRHHFAVCFEGRLSRELKEMGARLNFLVPVRTRYPWTVFSARKSLLNLLNSFDGKLDAIICHMPWSLAIFGPAVRKFHKAPLVFWLHDALSGKHWLERWAGMTKPDFSICNSQFTAGTLKHIFKDAPHGVVRYPGVKAVSADPEKRRQLRRELNTGDDECVIVQVSRMEPYKGHLLHLQALSQVPGDWVLWMIGGAQRPKEMTYLAQLKNLEQELKISDKVRFLGERKDVPYLLMAADLFCQPNLRAEPFGMVFIEALYAKLPLVTTEVGGGGSEIVDATCGLLAKAADPKSLAGCLSELVNDPVKRKELGANGPARADSFCDLKNVIASLIAVIRNL